MRICTDCHAGCCRRFNIQVTGYDMIRLKNSLGLDYLKFAQITPVASENVEEDSKRISIFKFINLPKGDYYAFFLRSINSTYIPDSNRCMFLQEWNDKDFLLPDSGKITARCGIYESRPLTCRIYPTRLHENGLIALTKNPDKYLSKAENPAYEMCNVEFTQENVTDESGEVIKSLIEYGYEMRYFRFLAETWNKGSCDFGEFFDFLEEAYKNRLFLEE